MNIENLYGIYELESLETHKAGILSDDKATSGMFVFTRDHKLSVVSGSTEWVMAYTGTFEIKENQLVIHTGACVLREREGTTMQRTILKLDGKHLVLVAENTAKQEKSVLMWRKTIAL